MSERMIPFNRPVFLGDEHARYLSNALQTNGVLASGGPVAQKCDDWLSSHFGTPTLTTSSATHALEMAALLLDLKPGDEVIIPSHAFVTAATAFALRDSKIVFCDCDENGNLCLESLQSVVTARTRAVVLVHYLGSSLDMQKLLSFCSENRITVIEDAAQAFGAQYKGKPLGTFGALGCISFHDTKNVTAGQGGALIVNDARHLKKAHILRDKGTNRREFIEGKVNKYSWIDLGSSYALSEINAHYLFPQLEKFNHIQSKRKNIWHTYAETLTPFLEDKARILNPPEWNSSSWHAFSLLFSSEDLRNQFIELCKKSNVTTHTHFVPLHSSPFATQQKEKIALSSSFTQTDKITSTLVRLPLYYNLADEELSSILSVTSEVLKSLKEFL